MENQRIQEQYLSHNIFFYTVFIKYALIVADTNVLLEIIYKYFYQSSVRELEIFAFV